MIKKLLLFMLLLLAAHTVQLKAQDVLKGYYRIQNGYGITANSGQTNDGGYVQVTDLLWAAPNQTADQVKTQAGSVIYVNAQKQADGRYKIVNLRSQGVEVVGGEARKPYAEFMRALQSGSWGNADTRNADLRTMINQGYLRWGRAAIETGLILVANVLDQHKSNDAQNAQALTDGFNKAVSEDMDIDMYLTPTTLTNGTQAYLFNVHTLKLQNVSDYVAANAEQFGYAFESMRQLMKNSIGRTGEDIQDADTVLMNKIGYPYPEEHKINPYTENDGSTTYQLNYNYIFTHPELLFYWLKLNMYKFLTTDQFDNAIKAMAGSNGDQLLSVVQAVRGRFAGSSLENYFNRIHWDTDYYLIDGTVSAGNAEGTPGDTYTYMGRFGVANNNKDKSYYAPEIATAKDGAKWVMKPVDAAENYYGITANSQLKGRDGKYYTTLYVDFPIDVAKSKAANSELRFWTVSGSAVNQTVNQDGASKDYAFLPLTEFTDYVPARTPVIVETNSTDAAQNKIVPSADDAAMNATATVYDGFHGTCFNVGKTNAADNYGSLIEQVIQKLFGYSAGNMTTELATRYGIDNTSGTIYTLNKNSKDVYNPMGFYKYTGTSLTANKAFIIPSASAPAKFYFGFPEATGTTAIEKVDAPETPQTYEYYDLQGRRVSHPTHGVYIVNGKKVIINK